MKRVTFPAASVLYAISKGKTYGFEIMDYADLPSGTVYPILRRFEEAGLVSSGWDVPEKALPERRHQRRYYKLTEQGRQALARATKRYGRLLDLLDVPASGAQPVFVP